MSSTSIVKCVGWSLCSAWCSGFRIWIYYGTDILIFALLFVTTRPIITESAAFFLEKGSATGQLYLWFATKTAWLVSCLPNRFVTERQLIGGNHPPRCCLFRPFIAWEMRPVSCAAEIRIHRYLFRVPLRSYTHLWYCTFQQQLLIIAPFSVFSYRSYPFQVNFWQTNRTRITKGQNRILHYVSKILTRMDCTSSRLICSTRLQVRDVWHFQLALHSCAHTSGASDTVSADLWRSFWLYWGGSPINISFKHPVF